MRFFRLGGVNRALRGLGIAAFTTVPVGCMEDLGCEDTLTCNFAWDASQDASDVPDAGVGEVTSSNQADFSDSGPTSTFEADADRPVTPLTSPAEAGMDTQDALRVESITPDDQEVGVALDSVVEIVFSDEPPPSVLEGISLTRAGELVPVDVEVTGNTVTLNPTASLQLAVDYVVQIDANEPITIEGDLQSSFATRDGEWGPVLSIDQGSGTSSSPTAAMLPDGTAVVLWAHANGGVSSIYSAVRRPASNWSEPVLVDEATDGNADLPTIVSSTAGHVYAAWHRYEGDRDYVRGAAFVDGQWSTPETLSTNATCNKNPDYSTTCNARTAKASVNAQGVVIAGWSQMGASYMQQPELVTRRRDPEGSWGSLATIGGSNDLDLALDGTGNAMATVTYRGYLQISRLPGDGLEWTAAENSLAFDQSRPSGGAQLRFDGRGDAHAVWPTEAGMQAAVYREETGWSETALVGDGTTSAVVAASNNNTVLVAWVSPLLNQGGISGNRFTGEKWEEPEYLSPPVVDGEINSMGLDSDANGNGLLVWTQTSEPNSDIWWNRYAFGAWQAAAKLDTAAGSATNVDVDVNSSGRAVVGWQQGDSSSSIYARTFE